MRIWAILFTLFIWISPVQAQTPASFPDAERSFNQLTVSERMDLQLLLTAVGYWPAVPNVNFSRRLFSTISQFQIDNGLPVTGISDDRTRHHLRQIAAPLLRLWAFRSVPHPYRGHPIWVPMGLGLQAERNNDGIVWKDPKARVQLRYQFYANLGLAASFDAVTAKILSDGGQIHYKVLKSDFFAISSTTNGIDSYARFHRNGPGVLGFSLLWQTAETALHVERIATLISGSLWASMNRVPFPAIPTLPSLPSSDAVAVSRPPEPAPPKNPESIAPTPAPSIQPSQKSGSSGTGFFINAEGFVLTNAHVVDGCSAIHVTAAENSSGSEAQVVARDVSNDLAVLKTTLKPTKFAAFRTSIRLGESVEAFGFPLASILSSSGNFTLGNVTALSGVGDDSRFLQVSTPVQPGNSGGPLLDQNGNVVGIVSSKLNAIKIMIATNGDVPQNVNFAIKGSLATSFLDSNRITVSMGTATQQVSAPDLADQARMISAFIRCQ